MIIAVDMGHTKVSTGASGYLDELTEDRKIGAALISELVSRGHKVVNVTPADNSAEWLTGRAQRANQAGAHRFVSIHLNAGGGSGTEVYTTASSSMKAEAAKISANVAACLGLPNRGHKTANFTVLAKTTMGACLVEVCFVDRKSDADAYRATTPEAIAKAIADGIDGKASGGAPVESPAQPSSGKADPRPIEVDGKWGSDTTLALQHYFEAPYKDAKISRQNSGNRDCLKACTTGWEWQSPPVAGSQTIRLLQGACGMAASEIDGVMGPASVRALQEHLGMAALGHVVDGRLDYPSPAVAEMQRRLNAGNL